MSVRKKNLRVKGKDRLKYRNPLAASLANPMFRQRKKQSKKVYNRKKEKQNECNV